MSRDSHLSPAAQRAYQALTDAGVTTWAHAARDLANYTERRLLTRVDVDAILGKFPPVWDELAEEAYRRLLQDVAPPAGDPAWVDRAVAAIRTWEPDLNVADMAPSEVIERLLSTWRWAERLTDAQVDEVIYRVLEEAHRAERDQLRATHAAPGVDQVGQNVDDQPAGDISPAAAAVIASATARAAWAREVKDLTRRVDSLTDRLIDAEERAEDLAAERDQLVAERDQLRATHTADTTQSRTGRTGCT